MPIACKNHSRKTKRPRDVNQLAKAIVDEATSDAPPDTEFPSVEAILDGKNPAAVTLGRLGGKKGGRARAKKREKEKLREATRKAVMARWSERG